MVNENQLKIISTAIDECSKSQLESVFAPIVDLPGSCTKAEMISHCLNKELGAYGFETYITPDQTAVFINDEGMSKVIDFLKGKGYQPVLTDQHVKRIGTIMDFADKNKINILWAQSGISKPYYYFKQYGFNGVNLVNLLQMNTNNRAAAMLSPFGYAKFSIGGVVALSWSGSLFLSTLENFIPNNFTRVKTIVSGTKVVIAFPVRVVEWTANQGTGALEYIFTRRTFPTNVTDVYNLTVGPKLSELNELKKPVLGWALKLLNKFKN